jgi:hypothetical protein
VTNLVSELGGSALDIAPDEDRSLPQVDADETLELDLAIWRQEADGDPFVRLSSLLSIDFEEIDAELSGFSRYALAY